MIAKRFGFPCVILILLIVCRGALAHPMGNFSVNHYSRLTLESNSISVRYDIDLAEIPAYQELQQAGVSADPNDPAACRFLAARGAELGRGLRLSIDGTPVTLHLKSRDVLFPPGAGGLPTLKMGFTYEASYPPTVNRSAISLHYADTNYPGHSGWKEVVAVSPHGSILKSSVPAQDRSAELTNYPADLLTSAPQDLEAALELSLPPVTKAVPAVTMSRLKSGRAKLPAPAVVSTSPPLPTSAPLPAPAQTLHANQQKTPRNRFTELITAQKLSLWFLFTAALIAISLGGLHALEPGHGKTIVAAYLVGSRGTARHAVLLGLIVTASHTAGVFALGALTLYASRYIVPEQLYPWLGVLSGLMIAILGCYMFLRRVTGTASDHSHLPGESRGFHLPWKRRSPDAATVCLVGSEGLTTKPVSLGQLLTLGITGGIIPCPAALIVLLSAFALHRIALGFFLIVAFSLGLAAVLIGFGMLMVYARRFMLRLHVDGPLTRRWLPITSSACITGLGILIALQGFHAANLSQGLFSKQRLGPVLFVTGLGLLLGMRHSTDPDHVVAISTIVTNQRSIRNAAFIGSIWGIGHTIMIFAVGALIILAGVKIPPRLGLAMEFSVALMLILLGILNLTGTTQRLSSRYSRDLPTRGLRATVATPSPQDSNYFQRSVIRFGLYQCVRPLLIGLVHGLAGSAAVALLVLSTIHNPIWATAYLLVFGLGTVIGMMCMTAAIAVPLTFAGNRFSQMSRYFGVTSGIVSVCFGLFLVYQLGFVGGLFSQNPQWTPR